MVQTFQVIMLDDWEEYVGVLLDVKNGFLLFKDSMLVIPTNAYNLLEPLTEHIGEKIGILRTD